MAAAQFLSTVGGDEFFSRLQRSHLIEVIYFKNYSQDRNHRDVIRLLEVLLRAVSHRFNDVCENNPGKTIFTAEQVLGCSEVQLWCEDGQFSAFMACIAKWLYTSKLDDDVFLAMGALAFGTVDRSTVIHGPMSSRTLKVLWRPVH
ncbi:uncharacterized protein RCO7_03020 [Rhynchosporium graminicola]|uniref:Uncharacterized protein n=1 Tax=Rhynchosporium graminicola TaxID=2792576 RepID=A0A1E1KRG5_9HELO|nr:uncharacterized protein RCO7_03020 [Rhynchosporium commune]